MLNQPMSSPMMNRIFGFFAWPKQVETIVKKAAARTVVKDSFVFIGASLVFIVNKPSTEISSSRRPSRTTHGLISISFISVRNVFVNFSVLHDHEEIFSGVFDELNVCNRIAIHEQQVRQGTCFDNAEFSGIGIARSG